MTGLPSRKCSAAAVVAVLLGCCLVQGQGQGQQPNSNGVASTSGGSCPPRSRRQSETVTVEDGCNDSVLYDSVGCQGPGCAAILEATVLDSGANGLSLLNLVNSSYFGEGIPSTLCCRLAEQCSAAQRSGEGACNEGTITGVSQCGSVVAFAYHDLRVNSAAGAWEVYCDRKQFVVDNGDGDVSTFSIIPCRNPAYYRCCNGTCRTSCQCYSYG